MNATMICFGGGGANQAKKTQKKEKIPYTKCSRAKAGNEGKETVFRVGNAVCHHLQALHERCWGGAPNTCV